MIHIRIQDKEAQGISDKLAAVKREEKQRLNNIRNKEADIKAYEELLTVKPPKIESEDELADQLVRFLPGLQLFKSDCFPESRQAGEPRYQGGGEREARGSDGCTCAEK